jgi:putative ABC transport system permease protein
MNLFNLIKIAVRALLRNKGRTLLTMLGIIIGIASVIAMVSLGQSSTISVTEELSSMGSNMIMVSPAREMRGGVNLGRTNARSLDKKDLQTIRQNAKYVDKISPLVTTAAQLVVGGRNHPGSIQGVSPEYLDIRKYELENGTMFTEDDIKRYSKVCVIGKTVADNLFPDGESPLGKTIRFGAIPMKVVGVLESKGQNQMGQDQDDVVFVPYTTVQKRFMAITYFNMLFVSAVSESKSELAATEITYILRHNHNIKEGAEDDFEIRTQEELLTTINSITKMLTLLLAAIASISFGCRRYRHYEYYVCDRYGTYQRNRVANVYRAQQRDILIQFLSESVILSLLGGFIGILLGLLLSFGLSKVLDWPFIVSEGAILISFLVCAATGIFFGWYPAKRAANLDPINALRYE